MERLKKGYKPLPRLEGYEDYTRPDYGFPMEFYAKEGKIFSSVTVPKHMGGWRDRDQVQAHPGAVSMILDTVMNRGAIYLLKRSAMAKSLSVEYFKPVPIGKELQAESKVLMKRGEGEVVMESVLSDNNGNLLAKGIETFDLYTPQQLRDLALCRPQDILAFEQMLKTL